MIRVLRHPIFWGVFATSIVVAFGIWIGTQEYCSVPDNCNSKFFAFLNARPNEIGDTLAGFAGSLAFIWIIVTVWLQSLELSEQREELRLTRLEMSEQRKATQDMARSLASQAKIFEFEQLERLEKHSKDSLNSIVSSVAALARDIQTNEENWRFAKIPDPDSQFVFLGDQSFDPFDEIETADDEVFVRKIADGLGRTKNKLQQGESELEKKPDVSNYVELHRLFVLAGEEEKSLSTADKIRFEKLRIREATERLQFLLQMEIWNPRS